VNVDFAELWHYRELLLFQVLRGIKVRYKQTALGAAWAILQPVLTMAAFTIFSADSREFPLTPPSPAPPRCRTRLLLDCVNKAENAKIG